MKTTVEELSRTLVKCIDDYMGAVESTAQEAVDITAKEAVKELKNAHPAGSGKYGSWNEYNKSWTIMKNTVDKRHHRGRTIHNKDHYRLTHLLEKGHALRQGGRSRAFPHIAPVAERAEENLFKRIKNGI